MRKRFSCNDIADFIVCRESGKKRAQRRVKHPEWTRAYEAEANSEIFI